METKGSEAVSAPQKVLRFAISEITAMRMAEISIFVIKYLGFSHLPRRAINSALICKYSF
jgi:hypothetical protein